LVAVVSGQHEGWGGCDFCEFESRRWVYAVILEIGNDQELRLDGGSDFLDALAIRLVTRSSAIGFWEGRELASELRT
jgi:hypothetical protein